MTMIVPHVAVVGIAPEPMVLLVVGFQLLIHVKGAFRKALAPKMMMMITITITLMMLLMMLLMMIITMMMMVPIEVTLEGIVTDVSPLHETKATTSKVRVRVSNLCR